MRFNTMISALMEYTNGLTKARKSAIEGTTWSKAIDTLLLLIAPSAPHFAEELWEQRGRPYSIHQQSWPAFDAGLAADDVVVVAVQVNGKLRDRLTVPADADEATVREMALASDRVQAQVDGHAIARIVYVPGRLLNVVVT